MEADDALRWMVEDIHRSIRTRVAVAVPLLDADGVVWQITTLEDK